MFIIFGFQNFGKVDAVPGICHVATQFGHLHFFPLLPNHSYLVLEKPIDGIKELPIRRSRKSVLVAWLRGFLCFAMLMWVGFIQVAPKLVESRSYAALSIVTILCLIPPILLLLSYRLKSISRASIDRMREFAALEGLPQRIRIRLKETIQEATSVEEEA